MNAFDDTLETITGGSKNPFDAAAVTMAKRKTDQLRSVAQAAIPINPEQRAEHQRIADGLLIPVDQVDRNPDFYRAAQKVEETPFDRIAKESPTLAAWFMQPEHAAIAHDDLENLGALEWLTTAPQRAIAQGINQIRFAQLKNEGMFRSLSRDEQDQLESYRFHMDLGGALGAGDSWWRKAITGTGQVIPNLAGASAMALKYGALGAVQLGLPAAAVGSILPGFGTVTTGLAAAGVGARAGAIYGAGKLTYQLESGLALDEYERFRDESHQPIDEGILRAAALGTGVINAGLEVYGLEKLAESFPGMKSVLRGGVRGAVKEALKRPTVRAALAAAIGTYGKTLTIEAGTEVAQRAATILSGEIAKAASGQDVRQRSLTQEVADGAGNPSILQDLVNEGVGAVQSFALTVLPGPLMEAAHARQAAQAAQGNADFFRDLGKGVADSKAAQRAPEAVQELLKRAVENGPVSAVYAPTDTWTTYWQSKGVDPAAMAEEVTGNPKALEDAQTTGNLTIPTERYAMTLAPTEHNEFFANELRMAPDEMNTREALAFKESEVAKAAEARQAEASPRDQVRQQMQAKLEAANVPTATAAPLARLVEAGVGQVAENAGLDPFEVYQRYGIEITRPTSTEAAAAPATAESVAPGETQPSLIDTAARAAAPLVGATAAEFAPVGAEAASAPAAAVPATGSGDANAPIQAMGNIGAAAVRMLRENPNIMRDAARMREKAMQAGRIPEPARTVDAGAQKGESVGHAAAPTAGTPAGDRSVGAGGELAPPDTGGRAEGGGHGARAERRQLPSPTDLSIADRPFERASKDEDAARLTPEVTRELARIGEELHEFPYVGRTWTFLSEQGGVNEGNAAGGKANVVAGAAGAPVYDDVLDFSPLSKGRQGQEFAKQVRGSRAEVEQAVANTVETGRIWNNLAEGAVRVAERRAAEDYRFINRPLLPPAWGTVATKEFTDQLSDAIDAGLEDADTSFDPREFGQSLLDVFDNADKSAALAATLPEKVGIRIGDEVSEVASIEDAGRRFDATREDFQDAHGPGARDEFPDVRLVDMATGKDFARIAWNGRIFTLEGDAEIPRADNRGYGKPQTIDALATGEQQPRLPGAENVRDQNIATPTPEAPFSLTGEASTATKGKQTTLFQSTQRAEAFKRWFGASKVVNEKGNPLVVYHGTDQQIESFDTERSFDGGIYFTDDQSNAEEYSRMHGRDPKGEPHVVSAYLAIENPLVIDRGGLAFNEDFQNELKDRIAEIRASGARDGIIVYDTDDHAYGWSTTTYIAIKPEQVKSVDNVGIFDPSTGNIYKQERRGAIVFGPDRKVTINLFEKADLSTFLHETGHFFLELFGDVVDQLKAKDVATLTPQQQRLIADYGTLLEQLGVERRADIGELQHETFARTFEAYLRDGTAPSLSLQESFSKFRAWLLGVYRSLKQLNVTLTPEVRGVLDRMLASDDEIAAAEARGRFSPLFVTAEQAGMTPGQFDLYRARVEDAHRKAVETLDAKLQGEVRREQENAWKAERAEIRADVAAQVYQMPVYEALAAIRFGEHADGSPLVEGMEVPPLKLSRQAIVDRYGLDRLTRLPKPYIYTRMGGVDPELVAERFGFSSGDELLRAIEQAAPMNAAIDHETDRQMIEKHGSLLLDGSVADEAQAAAASTVRDGVLREELRALWDLRNQVQPFVAQAAREGKQAVRDAEKERAYERRWLEAETKLRIAIAEGRKQVEIDRLEQDAQARKAQARGGAVTIRAGIPSAVILQQTAAARIARTVVKDINPATYWSASRRAATQAVEHAARQDFDAAIEAKTSELLNVNLYREAEKAKADIAARVERARDLASPKSRARIGLAGSTFLEQIDGILDRYNFAKMSAKDLAKRARMRDWIEAMTAQGLDPVNELPAEALDDLRRVDYQAVPYEELVGITDALAQIVHLARLKNRGLKTASAEAFSTVRDTVLASIREHNPARTQPVEFDAAEERKHKIATVFAAHTKMATLARMIDGHQDGGVLWEAFIRPINAAQDEEQRRRGVEGQAYRAVFDEHYPGADARTLKEKVYIPEIGNSLSKEARIAVALNWGNDLSRSRLMADPTRRWTQPGVEAILRTLDANDLRFVNATWKYIDHFWPEIAAKQERVVGLAPEKVEGTAFTQRSSDGVDVEMTGGYYPLVYDSRLVARAMQNEQAGEAKLATAAAYVRTTTRRGHIEQRLKNVRLSVRLDLGVAFQHVDQVIHDLTHHEMLIDATRLLRDPRISAAILETRGSAVYQQFTRGLQAIAGAAAPGQMDGAVNWLRTRTQLAAMGWNVWTALQQPLGLFNGAERVGTKWVARGMVRWLKDAASLEATTKWIADVSPFMAERTNTATQDIADLRQSMLKPGGWFDGLVRTVTLDTLSQKNLLDSYLWHIGLMQRVADVPTWLGAYEKAMADPVNAGDDARAVALADQAVRDSQGSGNIADLADVQRGPAWAKLFMTFYSYGNTVFNRTAAIVDEARGDPSIGSAAKMIGHLGLLYVMPAIGTVALQHALGKRTSDNPEDWAKELATETLSTALNTMVLLREVGGAVELGLGLDPGVRGYEGPAGLRPFGLAYDAAQQIHQGKVDEGLAKAFNALAGVLFQYPAVQAQKTVDGFIALQEGRTRNPFALLVGAPPKKTGR